MTIDDYISCPHKELYIIGIQQEEDLVGQYWFNCVDCKTTGIDKLIGYKAIPYKITDGHQTYIKK